MASQVRLSFEARRDAGAAHLARIDPLMRGIIRAVGPCLLVQARRRTPYEALVRAVMFQQLHANAANAILNRFVASIGDGLFPSPERVLAASDEALRAVGLSRQKLSYVRDIASKAASGVVPLTRAPFARLSDEAIIERVTQAHGVGRWSAEMLLIFTLGRLDVLPVDDYGVRAGYARASNTAMSEVTPRALADIGQRWSPYRSVAAWYLWRAADAGT